MRPSELSFDKIHMWARVVNLPFNLRNDKWCGAIAKQIDKEATRVQFDHANGYLRARVSVDVEKPLRWWILIESARRKSKDLYDILYENVPHFCFSCGRLGHSDLHCPTPGTRDAKGDLPFGKGLRHQRIAKNLMLVSTCQKSNQATREIQLVQRVQVLQLRKEPRLLPQQRI